MDEQQNNAWQRPADEPQAQWWEQRAEVPEQPVLGAFLPVPEQPKKRRKGRVIALVVGCVAAAVGIGVAASQSGGSSGSSFGSPSWTADPWSARTSRDDQYVAAYREMEPGDSSDRASIVSVGHAICSKFDSGYSYAELMDVLSAPSVPLAVVGRTVRLAATRLCPEHADKIGK